VHTIATTAVSAATTVLPAPGLCAVSVDVSADRLQRHQACVGVPSPLAAAACTEGRLLGFDAPPTWRLERLDRALGGPALGGGAAASIPTPSASDKVPRRLHFAPIADIFPPRSRALRCAGVLPLRLARSCARWRPARAQRRPANWQEPFQVLQPCSSSSQNVPCNSCSSESSSRSARCLMKRRLDLDEHILMNSRTSAGGTAQSACLSTSSRCVQAITRITC
jgi:hypothetical protein